MFKHNEYDVIESEDSTTFKAKKPNERGFTHTISFTKDPKEHEEAMEAIKEFFIREVL